MAYVASHVSAGHKISHWLHAVAHDIKLMAAKRAKYRETYRETYRELARLTERDLADLGIARADITLIARQAAAAV